MLLPFMIPYIYIQTNLSIGERSRRRERKKERKKEMEASTNTAPLLDLENKLSAALRPHSPFHEQRDAVFSSPTRVFHFSFSLFSGFSFSFFSFQGLKFYRELFWFLRCVDPIFQRKCETGLTAASYIFLSFGVESRLNLRSMLTSVHLFLVFFHQHQNTQTFLFFVGDGSEKQRIRELVGGKWHRVVLFSFCL